ncbi:hypothetical protein [Nocardia wallacei]|nr:hypothetical protein [Nocardia wallacei]
MAQPDCAHDPSGFDDLTHARYVLITHDGHGGCLPYVAATAYCGGLAEDL